MNTQSLHHQMADLLLDLEREMRQRGLWDATRPTPEQLNSTMPFAVDTLTFPQWLQFIFVERMGVMVEQGMALPSASGIQPMAEEYFKDSAVNGVEVVNILGRIDQLLAEPR